MPISSTQYIWNWMTDHSLVIYRHCRCYKASNELEIVYKVCRYGLEGIGNGQLAANILHSPAETEEIKEQPQS